MVGATLNCPRRFTLDELLSFMTDKGVYRAGDQSFFHALDKPLVWLGLRCWMRTGIGPTQFAEILQSGSLIIMEAGRHVIVIFSVNVDGTLVIGDPAMRRLERNVPPSDYRLKGTGRIWEVRR